jgi:hypothetical protein
VGQAMTGSQLRAVLPPAEAEHGARPAGVGLQLLCSLFTEALVVFDILAWGAVDSYTRILTNGLSALS